MSFGNVRIVKRLSLSVFGLLAAVLCMAQTATLNVTVVHPGSSIACDIGPPYTGAIPAAATQAGFTHCAANYDFTQTQSFTDHLGTHQWSNLSTWFSCANTGSWLFSYKDFSDTPCDTAHVNVGLDGGVQTLQLTYYLSDKNAGHYNVALSTASQVAVGIPPSGTNGVSYPPSFYIEHTLRNSAITGICNLPGCITYELGTYAPNYNINNPCFVSSDFEEMWSDPVGPNGGLHLWNPTCGTSGDITGPATHPGPVVGPSYATYGYLWTDDGSANFGSCNYYRAGIVNGLAAGDFRSCISPYTVVPPSSSAVMTARQNVLLSDGPQSSGQGGSNWVATSQTTYIARITVWACAGYATGICVNNPVITTHP